MNYLTLTLCTFLLVSLASVGSADRYFSDLRSGGMSVSFSPNDGLSVSYDGVSLVRDSTLWVHNPAWNYHYYGLPHLKDEVKLSDIDGGREAIIPHRSEWFEGIERVTVTDRCVSVRMDYKLLKDVSDADMEYCFGSICAAPIIGRPFQAVFPSADSVSGVVPISAASPGLDESLLTKQSFSKIEFASRIGKMTIQVTGTPTGVAMFDRRLNPYEQADKQPIFWCGVLGIRLEYGKQYSQTVSITVDPVAGAAVPPAEPKVAKAAVHDRADLRSPSTGPVYVIPEPQEMTLSKSDFELTAKTLIVVGEHAKPEDLRGAQSFAEEMKLLYGFKPKIVRESQAKGAGGLIIVGEATSNKLVAKAGLAAPSKAEGYALRVTPKQVLVVGHDRQGTYYGMQTLKQLVKACAKSVSVQGCKVSDWPSLRFRGVHLFPGNKALPFHKKLIDRIFSRFKMNHLILEIGQLKWKSDPELAVHYSQDQAEISTEIDFANEHFMEVSPLLQSLGHCDWMFTNDKNRDLAEYPERPYAYCPTNPRTYDYVFKFYEETLKLFRNPEFVHIGHDEVTEPGGFPKHEECKKRSAEQIFIDDTLKVRDYLSKRGSRIMMWGDMMLSKGDAPDAMNAKSPEDAKWMRDQLPKDVVITDWHYQPGKPEEFKSIGMFTNEGHDTIASTWYTPSNIETFSKQAKNVGALGLLQTTWCGYNSHEGNLKDSFNQFTAMILAAEYAWNSGKTTLDDLPYKWDEEFRKQWDPKPIDRTARRGFVVDLSSACNISLADDESNTGWMGFGPKHDLSQVPTGELRFKGDLLSISRRAIRLASSLDDSKTYPAEAEIAISRKAHSLLFVHTCTWTDRAGRSVGSYRVNYSDGTSQEIPLVYGANTSSWLDQRSVNGCTRVWEGRTRNGQKAALQKLTWENPNPNKEIRSVKFISSNTEAGPVLVALSGVE